MKSKPAPKETARPQLLAKTEELHGYISSLSVEELMKMMSISRKLAEKVGFEFAEWNIDPVNQTPAKNAFLGDIYSGLQANRWSVADLAFAQDHLRILSGLYGILRPSDGVMPYRLEMGYKLPDEPYKNLYQFWGDKLAKTLPEEGPVVNLAAVEYSKTLTEYLDKSRFITPSFLTVNPKTGQLAFVVVHAKIARGAFASWMIRNRISDTSKLTEFSEIGYKYDPKLSRQDMPVFIAREFGGTGMSIRLAE